MLVTFDRALQVRTRCALYQGHVAKMKFGDVHWGDERGTIPLEDWNLDRRDNCTRNLSPLLTALPSTCPRDFVSIGRAAIMRFFGGFLSAALLLATSAQALKFDIQAHPGAESKSKERCIRNFVARDTLVVVTATSSGSKGDGMVLNMHVRPHRVPLVGRVRADGQGQIKDAVGNDYGKPKDIAGETRIAFTSHADSAFDVCFENILNSSTW